jgi:uncharacterized membrane protein YgaE (UPF0421/DUF939 family)
MSLESDRRRFLQQLEKFEATAHELRKLADKVQKKTEQIHLEAEAARKRARATRQPAQTRTRSRTKTAPGSRRKVG